MVVVTINTTIGGGFFPTAHLHINNEKLGWPLLEQKSAVTCDGTQVMNSNSTSGVQDPLINAMVK